MGEIIVRVIGGMLATAGFVSMLFGLVLLFGTVTFK